MLPPSSSETPPSGSTEPNQSPLSERHEDALGRFVMLWGEMATHWGINRTMAQIHALLFASDRPLDTDEIMDRLDISRGNANMNLRSLVEWNLVSKVHFEGSRRDYYVAEKDPWKISSTIIEERHRREIKPVEAALEGAIDEFRSSGREEPLSPEEVRFLQRMRDMHAFMQVFDEVTAALLPFLRERNAGKVRKLTGFAARLGQRRADDTEDA